MELASVSNAYRTDHARLQSIQQLFGATASSYRHNDVIYRQGDPVSCFFLVMEGHVKLVSIGASGDEFIKSILPVGEYFGPGVAFDTHALCEEMAIARGITRILPIPSDAMEYSSDKAGELNAGLIRSLAKQKRFQERRLERMRLGDMRCRVAGMLQTLAVHYGGPCMHGHAIDFRMTQDELANLVGASRQVVSGILSEFKALGIIGYTRSYICIEDMDRLEIRIEY